MTIYRYLQRLDAKEVDGARKGQATASREHHQTHPGPLPTRPNQRAELDFARLDLLVVDPADRLPIGRPTLAAIRDKYTGYPLGVFISFDPPSYRVAMECMLYAFLPKKHVKALFHTQHEYLAFGLPEVLVVDNAIELHRDLELARRLRCRLTTHFVGKGAARTEILSEKDTIGGNEPPLGSNDRHL